MTPSDHLRRAIGVSDTLAPPTLASLFLLTLARVIRDHLHNFGAGGLAVPTEIALSIVNRGVVVSAGLMIVGAAVVVAEFRASTVLAAVTARAFRIAVSTGFALLLVALYLPWASTPTVFP